MSYPPAGLADDGRRRGVLPLKFSLAGLSKYLSRYMEMHGLFNLRPCSVKSAIAWGPSPLGSLWLPSSLPDAPVEPVAAPPSGAGSACG